MFDAAPPPLVPNVVLNPPLDVHPDGVDGFAGVAPVGVSAPANGIASASKVPPPVTVTVTVPTSPLAPVPVAVPRTGLLASQPVIWSACTIFAVQVGKVAVTFGVPVNAVVQ